MKKLFRLKTFQNILFYMFLIGLVIGTLYGVHIFTNKLRYYSIIPFLPALYIIVKGMYKNVPYFINDFKLIDFKQ
jgi:hypothetical protein